MTSATTFKIAGPAGAGIKSLGQIFGQLLVDAGFFVADYNEYPSLVKGGHNTHQISFSSTPVHSVFRSIDFFFALKPGHWSAHTAEFTPATIIFSDENQSSPVGTLVNLPLAQLATDAGSSLSINMVCLGVMAYLLGFDQTTIAHQVAHIFPQAQKVNETAFNLGYHYALTHFSTYQLKLTPPSVTNSSQLIDGSIAFGQGFIAAGGDFYASYPMTPATGVLHYLAKNQEKYHLKVVHPEDEIAAASQALGAAFAGARAAVGTSGGGYALMVESVSFSAMAELGLVFYLASRPGPATGLPTWTSQGDLLFAVFSGHGEFPKVVLAPGDVAESYDSAKLAVTLATDFQLPVIVLTDKYLAESSASVTLPPLVAPSHSVAKKTFTPPFPRYDLSVPTGVSPQSFPGDSGGQYLANSYEHDTFGYATESADLTHHMHQKRHQKLSALAHLLPPPRIYGNPSASILIVAWGSVKAPILSALDLIDNSAYAFFHLSTLWPIDPEIKKTLGRYKKIIVVENNGLGQLTTLLKSQFDFQPQATLLKDDGRPFFPEEIVDFLENLNR